MTQEKRVSMRICTHPSASRDGTECDRPEECRAVTNACDRGTDPVPSYPSQSKLDGQLTSRPGGEAYDLAAGPWRP